MLSYLINYFKSFFYSPFIESKIWVRDVKQDTNETFICIKPPKPIIKQYEDYRSQKFLQDIKTFKFTNRNKKNNNV
jgi:hypothetical protein